MRDSVVAYCSLIGSDPMLVQGAGGNVSWKDDDTLWVKASGTWLSKAAQEDIFLPVDLAQLRAALARRDFAVTPRVLGGGSLRPSIETALHALMPHRIVVHLHPVEILAHVVCSDFELGFGALSDAGHKWLSVDYRKPGPELCEAMADALAAHPEADVAFLANHGIVVGGDDIESIDRTLRDVLDALSRTPAEMLVPFHLDEGLAQEGYVQSEHPSLHSLAASERLFDRLEAEWALYPDHVVFLGAGPSCVLDPQALKDSDASDAEPVFVRGRGVFSREPLSAAQAEQLACFYEVLVRIPHGNRPSILNDAQVAELVDWDAEKYRRALPH